MNSNPQFTARPSDIDAAERGRRLAQVYALLLAKAAERRARLAQAAQIDGRPAGGGGA